MSYLIPVAGKALVGGLAGALGRRLGNARIRPRSKGTITRIRRRQVASRSVTRKPLRVYTKSRRRYRSRYSSTKALWRAVRKLQRTSDPDVSRFSPSVASITLVNRSNQNISQHWATLSLDFDQMIQQGNQARLKSFNERIHFSMSVQTGRSSTTSSAYIQATPQVRRHVRVMYIVSQEAILAANEIFDFEFDQLTIQPRFQPVIGPKFRIVYDKTYSIQSQTPLSVFVRIPASAFYDGGQIKIDNYGSNNGYATNYMYRLILADSVSAASLNNVQIMPEDSLSIIAYAFRFWKYYDFGASNAQVTSLSDRVSALENNSPTSIEQTSPAGALPAEQNN